MTPEIHALRERFRDQMPGLAAFDELAGKYDRLLAAHRELEQRWLKTAPTLVKELRGLLQEIAATDGVPLAITQKITEAMKGSRT